MKLFTVVGFSRWLFISVFILDECYSSAPNLCEVIDRRIMWIYL